MRVCVIGNSHAAMIKHGWDRIADRFAGVELVFFASPADSLSRLVAQDGSLAAGDAALRSRLQSTSGGLSAIDPHAYDRFLLVGLQLTIPRRNHRMDAAEHRRILGAHRHRLSLRIAGMIRAVTDAPIRCLPTPRSAGDGETGPAADAERRDYAESVAELNGMLGLHDVVILGQPPDTLTDRGWTEARWGRGARTMEREGFAATDFPDGDRRHMNGNFGAVWLEQGLRSMTGGTRG